MKTHPFGVVKVEIHDTDTEYKTEKLLYKKKKTYTLTKSFCTYAL